MNPFQPTSESTLQPPLVLHVRVVAGSGGGPEKTIMRSARHADPAKLRVAAAYIHPHNDPGIVAIREQAKAMGCPLWEIGESGPMDPRTVRSLLQLCRKLRVAVWHGHDYKANALGLILRRLWPMKLVTTLHGWTRETVRTRLYYHVDNWCLPRYDHAIAVSPLLVNHSLENGIPADRVTYLSNAIDPDEFRRGSDGAAARREFGVDPEALVIGAVGRFSKEKGIERAIQTLADLRAKHPKIELHLIGSGPLEGNLKVLAMKLGVEDAVRFWGWRAKPQTFYEMMDVMLLPSFTEGSPNVVLESMAMGVPVAATDVGGVRELLDEGRCGVILNQHQETWAGHVAPLLVSAPRRREIARLARERIEQHYSFAQRMAREAEIYDRLLTVRPKPLRRAA